MSYKNSQHLTINWLKNFSYEASDSEKDKKEFFSQDHPHSTLNDENSIFKGKIAWDVFVCAMAIGKKLNIRKPLKKRSNSIPVSAAKENHIIAILGLIFSMEDADLDMLNEPDEIRNICEEYANAGAEVLLEWKMNSTSDDPLSEIKKEFKKYLTSDD